jgi:hypothetical protein
MAIFHGVPINIRRSSQPCVSSTTTDCLVKEALPIWTTSSLPVPLSGRLSRHFAKVASSSTTRYKGPYICRLVETFGFLLSAAATWKGIPKSCRLFDGHYSVRKTDLMDRQDLPQVASRDLIGLTIVPLAGYVPSHDAPHQWPAILGTGRQRTGIMSRQGPLVAGDRPKRPRTPSTLCRILSWTYKSMSR